MNDVKTEKLGFVDQILSLDNRYWIVNVMEMFERLAYYGVRAVIAIYMVLPRELGGPELTHIEKGTIFLWWAGFQSIIPMFVGGYADRYGHKKTIAIAIVIKIIGYVMMAHFLSFWGFFTGCMFLATGTAIFKPGVQGTLAVTLKGENASMGWGVFYQLVNVGGFLGPVVAGVLRLLAWKYVFYACAVIVAINFLWLPFYKDPSKDFKVTEAMRDPMRVFITSIKGIFRPRVISFCIVFSGFWLMFNQVFDLLPNMIDDWVDSSAIIGMFGNAFSTPLVPVLLAIVLALVGGFICAAGIFLAMRPDHRSTSEVPMPAYIIVSLALVAVYSLVFALFASGPVLYVMPLVLAVATSMVAKFAKIPAKILCWSSMGIAAISAFFLMKSYFMASAPMLIQMAADGQQVNPEWMINLNPGLIVFTMVFFGYMTSFVKPLTSIIMGMVVATVGSIIAGTAVFGGVCILGIAVFSIGEMLSSPKKMEYLASLAPEGQSGLYMGYVNFPIAIGWMSGSIFAGNRYEVAGDKVNLAKMHLENVVGMGKDAIGALQKTEVMPMLASKLDVTVMEAQKLLYNTYHPEKIWMDIGWIGLGSIIAMIIYDRVIRYVDAK